MLSLDSLIREAEVAHGHLCAGQILGVRLALFGLAKLGIDDPRGKDRKRLVTFVEIDRCATDAIAVVTGCRLGKRALKFRDWGKMAATFVDLSAKVSAPEALHTRESKHSSIPNVILSGADSSRSEVAAKSKDPYALNPIRPSQGVPANDPRTTEDNATGRGADGTTSGEPALVGQEERFGVAQRLGPQMARLWPDGAERFSAAVSDPLSKAALAAEGPRPSSPDTHGDHFYRAIRVAARESSKQRARELHPEIENKNQQQMLAYREMPDDDLFTAEWVKIELLPEEFPGYKADRIVCAQCGEGINFNREVLRDGKTLCRSCAGESYYSPLRGAL
jgi:formylmethanofuran dehydrogenase subunit E